MNRRFNMLALAAVALPLLPATLSAQSLTEVWRATGFSMPESAWFNAESGQIIVSNIGGFGPDSGADGSLALLSADGTVTNPAWTTGLVDPKGMSATGGMLYVADAPGIQVIDLATGALVETLVVPDAMLLNDVTVDADGTIYVTDMFAGGIWKIADGEGSWLVAAGGLPLPNGILADNGTLIVGSFGEGMAADMSVSAPGGLFTVDPASGAVAAVAGTEGTASVDGIARVGDWILYNDNPTGAIFGVGPDGAVANLGTTAPGAADHGSDGTHLIIPFLGSGEVVAYSVE